ncbi:MAG TPA: VCBS repeat-containing protein [Thermoanaerobaculia bacterium]|nr:VCBS repeat-containing protein [Thermoanaerobaculia bacterium]
MNYSLFAAFGVRRTFLALLLLTLSTPALRAQAPVLPPAKSGFPISLPGQGTNLGNSVFSQPVAADLGLSPGFKSIVFGLRNGKLYVIYRNPANGVWGVAPGWPVQLPSHIASSPAVGDLNNDGIADIIVVGFGSTLQGTPPNSSPGGLRAYRPNGTLRWQVVTEDTAEGVDGQPDPVVGSAAIGDVDGDGDNDVVFGGLDFNLYLVDGATGANLPGWPKFMRDTVFSTPVLHDLDGDGKKDVILGVDAHQEGSPFFTPDGGCVRAFRYDATGTGQSSMTMLGSPISEIPGFPKCVDQVVISSPAVGDIDGDGKPEIVHGTGLFWPGRQQKIYGWHCDGTPVWGTAQNPGLAVSGQVVTSPALADIDGNGILDVVFTTDRTSPSTDYRLHAVRANGTDIFPPVAPRNFFGSNPALSAGDPVVADVLDDAALEILVPTNTEIAVFSTAGVQLTETTPHPVPVVKKSFYTDTSVSGVLVTDLETNGAGNQTEVIVVSATPFGAPAQTTTQVFVWNPIARVGAMPWPMFHQNPQRTGVVPGTAACSNQSPCAISNVARNFFTLSPCRVIDTRNANGPLGGPVLSSGALRDFSVFGVCGIPVTARALSTNVTVVAPSNLGFVRFSPGCEMPVASVVNFSPNQTRGNNSVLSISPTGVLTGNAIVSGNGTVHVIVDVNGYYQ